MISENSRNLRQLARKPHYHAGLYGKPTKGATVFLSDELRKQWSGYLGGESSSIMVDPIEARIAALDVDHEAVNF